MELKRCGSGSGSNNIILIGSGSEIEEFVKVISADSDLSLWIFSCHAAPSGEEIEYIARQFQKEVVLHNLKRLTLFAIGWAGAIAIKYGAEFPGAVRRVIFWNPKILLSSNVLERWINWVEQYLPLGLPLRVLSKAYDPRPVLHRLRCPTLILVDTSAHQVLVNDSLLLSSRIPNAWQKSVELSQVFEELHKFLVVPTKQPQKNHSARKVSAYLQT